MYSNDLEKDKKNLPALREDFAAEFEKINKKLSGIKVDTERADSIKRLNQGIKAVRKNDSLSGGEKVIALLDVFLNEYTLISKTFGGSKSNLGNFIKDFCIENFGVQLNDDLTYQIKSKGLMMCILNPQGVVSSPKEEVESLLPPISRRSIDADHISRSAPSIGTKLEIKLRISPSLDVVEDREKIGQFTLRSKKELSRLGSMFGEKQFCYAEKPSGVEPGFRAIDLDHSFFQELAVILDETAPSQKLQELGYILRSGGKNLEDKQVIFSTFINVHVKGPHARGELDSDVEWLCKQVKMAVADNNQLNAWMYKMDYAEGQKDRIKANKEAIREFVATHFARIFSTQNQRQVMTWVNNKDGIHALLACGWKNGLQELTQFLYGGWEPDYNGVLVEDPKATVKRSKYVTGLAKDLIFELAIGDRDGMGKDAQNKGLADDAFFGFDRGKPYEGEGVASSLSDDFSFEDTFAKAPAIFRGSSVIGIARHFMYRNFSVFYDTALSERMEGFHLFRKMITGENPSENVIASYPGLRDELVRIQKSTPSSDQLLITLGALREKCQEESKLQSLIDTQIIEIVSGKLSNFDLYFAQIKIDLMDMGIQNNMPYEELSGYLKFINEMEVTARQSNQHILTTFEKRMELTAKEIDLLDHLEKYFSPTSVMSHDGDVFLNTMRFDPQSSRIPFQLKKEENGTFTITTKNKECARQLEEVFGLKCISSDAGLSCILTADELGRLMDDVNIKYNEKRDRLLIKPTYRLITFPNLVSLLNQGKTSQDPGVDVSFLWREDNSLSLRIIAKTEQQVKRAKELFGLEFKLNEAEMLEVPQNKHVQFQMRVEEFHENYMAKDKERVNETDRGSVLSVLARAKQEISPTASSKWNNLNKKLKADDSQEVTPAEILMRRLKAIIFDEVVLRKINDVIEETSPKIIEELLTLNDKTLTSPHNIKAIINERFKDIVVELPESVVNSVEQSQLNQSIFKY